MAGLRPRLLSETDERRAAQRGAFDEPVFSKSDHRAEEVAEGAVQLVDRGGDDAADNLHPGQPRAEGVDEHELARSLL